MVFKFLRILQETYLSSTIGGPSQGFLYLIPSTRHSGKGTGTRTTHTKKCFIVFKSPSSSACIYWAGMETGLLPSKVPALVPRLTPSDFLQQWQKLHMTFACILLSADYMMCLGKGKSFALALTAAHWVRWKFLPGSKDSIFQVGG